MNPKISTPSLLEEAAEWLAQRQKNERLAVMAVLVVVRKRKIKNCWFAMHKRCTNQALDGFHRYGGRGIKVCAEWARPHCIMNFVKWACSHGFYTDLMIDRENNDGDYSPSNCRWVTPKQSANNRAVTPAVIKSGKRSLARVDNAKRLAHLRKARNRPVIASNGAVYPSNIIAGRALGMVDGSGIGKCLHGRIKTSGGLTWKYL